VLQRQVIESIQSSTLVRQELLFRLTILRDLKREEGKLSRRVVELLEEGLAIEAGQLSVELRLVTTSNISPALVESTLGRAALEALMKQAANRVCKQLYFKTGRVAARSGRNPQTSVVQSSASQRCTQPIRGPLPRRIDD
jgi:hypothetical protein